MSATGHQGEDRTRVATTLSEAEFVRLVGTADGDALAAAGLLARGLDATEVPYQVSLAAVPEPSATEADCTVSIGHPSGDVRIESEPLAIEAAEIIRQIAPDAVDPELALAGAVCAGWEPSGWLLEAADLERRPGIAIPTDDLIEGIAGSTLVRTSVSGDGRAVEAALEELGDPDDREIASYLALSAIEEAPLRAAEGVERALRPYATDRFETLGGFADVLDALAREQPGTGIALALGNDLEAPALESWRTHGQRAHTAIEDANTGRFEGVYVTRLPDASPAFLGTVARLSFWYRSPEPIALAVTDGAAAAVGETSVAEPMREVVSSLDGRLSERNAHATATYKGTIADLTAAFREAL